MTWQLIDTETPVEKNAGGEKILIKPMTNGEKFKLAKAIQQYKDTDYDAVLEAIAPFVIGHDAATIKRIADPKTQGEIIAAVLEVSNLAEAERKNLSSSSAT